MARITRYLGYLNGLQKKDNRGRKTSTKESVLSRLKDLEREGMSHDHTGK